MYYTKPRVIIHATGRRSQPTSMTIDIESGEWMSDQKYGRLFGVIGVYPEAITVSERRYKVKAPLVVELNGVVRAIRLSQDIATLRCKAKKTVDNKIKMLYAFCWR